MIFRFYWTGKWQHVKDTTEIGEGKMFSPGNLRATFDNPEYAKVSSSEIFFLVHPLGLPCHVLN